MTGPGLGESEALLPPGRSSRHRRMRRAVRGIALDVSPLRDNPAYRRLWWGEAVSFVGSQMTSVALALQVYEITGSSFAVGLLGLFALVPLVGLGLFGGAVADAVDRRRLLVQTQVGLAASSLVLTAQAAAGLDQVWLLYLLMASVNGFLALNTPARRAVTPRLLPAAQLPAAGALSQVLWNFGMVVGPLIAGVLIGTVGYSWVYAVDSVSFVFAIAAVLALPPMPPEGGGTRAGVASVVDGLRYLRSRQVLLMTFLVDLNAMVFGMPRALFPALAATRFGGGSSVTGLLYAAPAVGALVGAVCGGWFGRIRRQGLAVLVAVAAWGAAIALFGLTRTLWLACVLLALAGAADMVSAVFRTTILQVATPDAMQGRLNGVFIVVVAGGPRLGDLEAGAVASLISPQFSVVSGGLVCIAGVVLLAALVPSFARYDAEHPTP